MRRLGALLALLVVPAVCVVADAAPTGQLTWAVHIALAPRWLDPSENDGSISVIDTAAAKVIKTFNVGHRPRHVAFMPSQARAYVTRENDGIVTVIDTIKHEPVSDIPLGEAGKIKPMSIALSPDAGMAYVSTGRGRMVFVVNTATDKVSASFEAGDRPWGIGVSPDGKILYTANGPSNDVSVIDLEKGSVIKKIPVAGSPWGILVLAD